MSKISNNDNKPSVVPVNAENWRGVAQLKVKKSQSEFVAEPCYYLALCNYGKLWNPCAITLNETVIGFLMQAIDDSDNSCWIGGFIIDEKYQNQGLGKLALQTIIAQLTDSQNVTEFALSYLPENSAKHLYAKLGFLETGEMEDDEIVARLKI